METLLWLLKIESFADGYPIAVEHSQVRYAVAEAVLIQIEDGPGVGQVVHLDRFDLRPGMNKEINNRRLYRACGANCNADPGAAIIFQVHDISAVISCRQWLSDNLTIDTSDGEIGITGSRSEGEPADPSRAALKASDGVLVLIDEGAVAGYAVTMTVDCFNGDQGGEAVHEVAAFGE